MDKENSKHFSVVENGLFSLINIGFPPAEQAVKFQEKIDFLSLKVTALQDTYGVGYPHQKLHSLIAEIYELSDTNLQEMLLKELLDKVLFNLMSFSPKISYLIHQIEEKLNDISVQPST